jgi:uncharacterized membrane protein
VSEWGNLLFRWIHVIFGIMWIGDSLLFNWLDRHFAKPETAPPGIGGELWLVHSGGFYQLLKRQVSSAEFPKALHWFRWEAAGTWLTGICLLWIVYYQGGILLDPTTSTLSEPVAMAIGVGVLIVGWAVYDSIWLLRLPTAVTVGVLYLLTGGVAYQLGQWFTGRAAYIHVGAMFGTIMVANVWMRILPAQRHMIAMTKAGKPLDPALGARAKLRSLHNSYLTYPILFIMISNHYPSTYGSENGWLILMAFFTGGMTARHFVMRRRA